MVETLHEIAAAAGHRLPGPQARPAGRAAGAGHPAGGAATCCARSPATCGSASARRPSSTRSPWSTPAAGASRPVLERAYNICCDLGLVAGHPGPRRPGRGARQLRVRPGNPVRVMLAQRLSRRRGDPGQAGRVAARPSTSTTACGSRRTAPPTGGSSCSPAGWSGSAPSSPTWSSCSTTGLGPREAILEGEVVAYDAAAGRAAPVPGGHVPPPQARHRRGGAATCRSACSASSCCTPTART